MKKEVNRDGTESNLGDCACFIYCGSRRLAALPQEEQMKIPQGG